MATKLWELFLDTIDQLGLKYQVDIQGIDWDREFIPKNMDFTL